MVLNSRALGLLMACGKEQGFLLGAGTLAVLLVLRRPAVSVLGSRPLSSPHH